MVMGFLKPLIFAFLGILATTVLVHAQNQTGFISIDCGIPENSPYTDKKTGIDYVSDATTIDTGVTYSISDEYKNDTLDQQFYNLRSFPEGTRNCYTIKTEGSDHNKLLIRARFMYGNYDGQGILPSFNLVLESDVWDTVEFKDAATPRSREIIHIPQNNYVYVCLENTGFGTPFISALEVRPLMNTSYASFVLDGSLVLFFRYDLGSTTNETIRYKDDVVDRIWLPFNFKNWKIITTAATDRLENMFDEYQVPVSIMSTAVTPAIASEPLQFFWGDNVTRSYHIFTHIADIQDLSANQTREFNISADGDVWYPDFDPFPFFTTTRYNLFPFSGSRITISMDRTVNSTLPPILNAVEIYWLKQFTDLMTNEQDVDAIMNIKEKYGVKRPSWQGDPCVPLSYAWEGLNCRYNSGLPKITSLNLSSSGLSGEISPFILGLSSIESLDLSNNNLTGSVPEFLSQLQNIKVLNLKGNNLKGTVPAGLQEKADKGLLTLRVDGNSDTTTCSSGSCKEKKKFNIVPVVASIVAVVVILAAIFAILWIRRIRKVGKNGSLELKNRRFSYSDVVKMTNNFERVLGRGGFGTVYYGYLDNTQTHVAVKMLSPSSAQGYKEFQAEVELLMRVHHKNLTALVGYCDENSKMGLIYEYMANGNLEANLSDNQEGILTWEGRIRIATEAAQGLEYLHRGCKPPIVHRDIKSTNILLNETFQAKLADFGLSKSFPVEGETHVSTKIAGTPGYLDPEYYTSNKLTEKSDVYSFGMVLLEIITGKPVIEKSFERTHISRWVSSMLEKADIRNIVDPKLRGDFGINSVWKAVEIAMACIASTSTNRPTMSRVVTELNESLATEIAFRNVSSGTESTVSMGLVNLDLHTQMSPMVLLADCEFRKILPTRIRKQALIMFRMQPSDTGVTYMEIKDAATPTSRGSSTSPEQLCIVCLENTGFGTPFIHFKVKDDCCRIWLPFNFKNWKIITTAATDRLENMFDEYQVPVSIMRTYQTISDWISAGVFITVTKHKVLNLKGNNLKGTVPAAPRKADKDRRIASFVSMETTSGIVGLSIAWSCTHRRPICRHLRTSSGEQDSSIGLIKHNLTGSVPEFLSRSKHKSAKLERQSQRHVPAGPKKKRTRVELLMRVHHKNLTALVGYCDEELEMD
ncbi:LRR receptor-like serine/threonine-protein kinase IOS1 [Pistacia vera]|uniref:LRR receptor-like serine/threonine-protein kinase IOS1 n=1 Tax=Pistacia vera TaxID=55513 RepID=UPI0012633349|nr:LRR receptor-like serine/threonine-protein kinase IOS1 [Pistacia vera]